MLRLVALALFGGLLLGALAPRAASAHPGRAIVVDRQGRIYFVDTIRDRLWRLTADGALTLVAEGVHTDRLFLTADGLPLPGEGYIRLLAHRADSAARRDVALRIAWSNEECVFFSFLDRAGRVYCRVAPRLIRIDSSGSIVVLGRDTALDVLETGTVSPRGTVYVADRHKILKIVAGGALELVAGSDSAGLADGPGAAARFGRILALAADSAGNLFVADHDNRRVRRIGPDGIVTTVATLAWPWRPTGLAPAPGGGVYILERRFAYGTLIGALVSRPVADFLGTPRVQRIWPHGSLATVTTVGGSALLVPVTIAVLATLLMLLAWGVRRVTGLLTK